MKPADFGVELTEFVGTPEHRQGVVADVLANSDLVAQVV